MLYDGLMYAIETIALEHPDGFTLQITTLELVTTGIAVGYEATQNSYQRAGLYHCIQHSIFYGGHIGGWRNLKGEMQYDSVRMFTDLRKAIRFGRKQKQVAIFDIDNGWEIIL